MMHINLHDYREELKKIEVQKRVVKAISIIGVIIFLILANWVVSQNKLDKIRDETQKLEKAVKKLDPQVKAIQKIQSSQKRKEQIVGRINILRGNQFPVSKIINDLNMAAPLGVWLDSVFQMTAKNLEDKKVPAILFRTPTSKKRKNKIREKREKKEKQVYEFIEIRGKALEKKLIAAYIKNLQGISYFKMTFLQKTQQTIMGGYPIHSFIAYSYMPEDKKK
tara:strand:- start:2031 stop:2696 length:666 start_codon:yes stop_codon:yes gene_type:complete